MFLSKIIKRSFLVLMLMILQVAHSQEINSEYTLGAGDVIKITVFGQSDLTLEARLSNTGVVKYPFLGELPLIGKTTNEVESIIDNGLRHDYLVNPSVSVIVLQYRPFFIDGEVKRPGGYPYQPGLSLDKAVALAGGFTERANREVFIIKRDILGEELESEVSIAELVEPGDSITIKSRFF